MNDPHLTIALELDTISHAGVGINQYLCDMGVHSYVKVFPENGTEYL